MRVQVLLKTPLFRGRFGPEHDKKLRESVVEIRGLGTARDGGLDIEVASLHNEKGGNIACPIQRIFIPASKIDFYVIETAADA